MTTATRPRFFIFVLIALGALALTAPAGPAEAVDGPRTISRTPTPTAADSLTLPTHLIPAEGMDAVYIIVEHSLMGTIDSSGIFFPGPEGADVEGLIGVIARYEVLAPNPRTGMPRLLVQARPIDPVTGALLGDAYWEAIYVVEGGSTREESATPAPREYSDLFDPMWLVKWTVTQGNELPQAELMPGNTWTASADDAMPLSQSFPVGELPLRLVGEFSGWTEPDDAQGRVALIKERVDGQSSSIQPISEHHLALVTYHLEGSSEYSLVPGHFPYGSTQSLSAGMTIELGPETGAPAGVEGHIRYTFFFSRYFTWDASGDRSWLGKR